MQTEIIQSKNSSSRLGWPFPLMTATARGWRKSVYNHVNYGPLRKICHDRCVVCGGRDWIFFERLDRAPSMLHDVPEMFRFWFAGLAGRQTVCICVDCSLEARTTFWDRRLSERFVTKPEIAELVHKYQYYYGRVTSRITLPSRARCVRKGNRGSRLQRLAVRHRRALREGLGNKCALCSQAAHLRFDCIRTQNVRHSQTIPPDRKCRFLYHQLLHDNLRLLCARCDARRSGGQFRAAGHFRRLLFGRKLVAWCDTNGAAADALALRMKGVQAAMPPVKPLAIPIKCSVESCGHVKRFHWLAASEKDSQLWFICEDCWRKAPKHLKRLALTYDFSPDIAEMNRGCAKAGLN